MRISWPHTHPWILQSFVASQVHRKSCNRSSLGVVHCRLSKPSKLTCLTHLNSLESIFIHYNIFWFSFALNIVFFLTSFSTYSSTSALPFHFIMILVFDLECWRIMLKIDSSSKSYWKIFFPLLISCYDSFSSIALDVETCFVCSSTTNWDIISTSSSEFEIIMTLWLWCCCRSNSFPYKAKGCF
jgi:hypothetical protein